MPICGIYKITNQINGKCYIGQSINIKQRWRAHKTKAFSPSNSQYECPLYRAIRKYGLENFSFEVLEECPAEELNQKEQQNVSFFQSNNPSFGYNLTPGGDAQGDKCRKLTELQVKEVQDLLLFSLLSQEEISKKFGVTQRTISSINTGECYFDPKINYPIRSHQEGARVSFLKKGQEISPDNYITKLSDSLFKKCEYCGKNIQHSDNKRFCSQKYAQMASRIVERPSREILKSEIREQPFTSLGKKYSVSDNAVRRWCKTYNLPFKKSEIKSYSDEQWDKI